MKQKNSGKRSKMKVKDISESSLGDDLKDPEFVVGYLEDVLKQASIESFLTAIKLVAKANGGMKKLASKSQLGRESMYKALSKTGNPQFSTLDKILRGMGLRFSVTSAARERKAA